MIKHIFRILKLPLIFVLLLNFSCKQEIDIKSKKGMIRADFFIKMKNYNEALAISDKISQNEPGYDFAHFVKGQALFYLGRIKESMESFNKVISLNPEYPGVYLMLGNAEGMSGNYKKAVAMYNKELALPKDSINAEIKQSVFLQMGRAYTELGNSDSALFALGKVLELNPKRAEAYNDMGQVYEDAGDLQKALKEREKALELNPNGDYQYQIGVLYVNLGQYEQAIPFLENAKKLHPEFQGVYYNLGKSLLALNKKKEGEMYIAKAEQIQNRHAQLGEAKSKATIENTPKSWMEYANMLREDKRYLEAFNIMQTVLSMDPQNEEAKKLTEMIQKEADHIVNFEQNSIQSKK